MSPLFLEFQGQYAECVNQQQQQQPWGMARHRIRTETQIHGRVIERGREGARCRRSKAEAEEKDKVEVENRVTVENRKLQMFHSEQRWLHHLISRIYEATSALPIEKPENLRDTTSSHSMPCPCVQMWCTCDRVGRHRMRSRLALPSRLTTQSKK